MRSPRCFAGVCLWVLTGVFMLSSSADATPDYSQRTEQDCYTCHTDGMGGTLTETGLKFSDSGYVWPPPEEFKPILSLSKTVRLIVGYFHITAAFLWFGTILYVHLLLRPAYASKGVPKGELRLGVVSMLVVGISGLLLTVSKIPEFDFLFSNQWGSILALKILLYLVMITSAFTVAIYIGPRLKPKDKTDKPHEEGVYDPDTLSEFNGSDGKPAFVAYQGVVYDVSALPLWKNGEHMKHLAGCDLTAAIENAPHDAEKLKAAVEVGRFDHGRKPSLTFHQKLFYVIAYMNLVLVFVILGLIAFLRWGIS